MLRFVGPPDRRRTRAGLLLVWSSSALTAAAAPSASASFVAEAPTAAGTQNTKAARRGFDEAKAAADEALSEDDWETLLDESDRALRLLPENEHTHGERAEVMQPVGAYKLDARSPGHLRRSARIVELYLEQLDAAYGEDARQQEDRDLARRYLDDIHRLVAKREPVVPMLAVPAPIDVRAPPPREQDLPRDGRNLIIGGGVSVGVGVVLLIVGITQGVRWKRAADDYEELRTMRESVDRSAEADAATEWSRAAGGALGTAIPGVALAGVGTGFLVVGLRRRRARNAQVGVAGGGLEVRF